jgi:hypothetical protein
MYFIITKYLFYTLIFCSSFSFLHSFAIFFSFSISFFLVSQLFGGRLPFGSCLF